MVPTTVTPANISITGAVCTPTRYIRMVTGAFITVSIPNVYDLEVMSMKVNWVSLAVIYSCT